MADGFILLSSTYMWEKEPHFVSYCLLTILTYLFASAFFLFFIPSRWGRPSPFCNCGLIYIVINITLTRLQTEAVLEAWVGFSARHTASCGRPEGSWCDRRGWHQGAIWSTLCFERTMMRTHNQLSKVPREVGKGRWRGGEVERGRQRQRGEKCADVSVRENAWMDEQIIKRE